LDKLLALVKKNEERKREQAEKGFDGLTYFVYRTVLDAKLNNAEAVAKKIKAAFVAHPNWTASEAELREVRKQVTFAIAAELDDLDQVVALVAQLFDLLTKAYKLDQ
jgi:type I restriction enzyme R subunit